MASPRWAPGPPLPATPYIPGTGVPRPELPIAETLAGDGAASAGFSPSLFGYGVDLFHAQCFWEAHECWEVLWRREPRGDPRRALLQGLILLAAARVKHRQGRPHGAAALHRRAIAQLERATQHHGLLGVDVRRLLAEAHAAGPVAGVTVTRAARP